MTVASNKTKALHLWKSHSFGLSQGHLVGLFGQILSSNQHADLLGPIRARLLPAAVDGLSDGQRHTKRDRLQVLQGETWTNEMRRMCLIIFRCYMYILSVVFFV